ncbi:putative nuclease [Bartonella australis AUST/NH1]|uniref:Putative nuclease n=1 Tax=Bartonella australis (strain Aust/NH1) TaxID=1094489 RepID=M1PD34_BARAA|nr:thermonuclease family protein [Bartonella australis]AGF74491.1 putative nuclease [Bartonella australis AUST/NH1]
MDKEIFYFNLKSFSQKVVGLSIFITAVIFANMAYLRHVQAYPQKVISVTKKPIKGDAFVIDGDTITINSVKIRLIGIDAPELYQFCGIKKGRYPCGLKAKEHLEKLVANLPVTCYGNKKDKYRRILATCRTEKVNNINAIMVRNGWAVSYHSYREEEREAKKKKKGIWQSSFQKPEVWRKTRSKKKKNNSFSRHSSYPLH